MVTYDTTVPRVEVSEVPFTQSASTTTGVENELTLVVDSNVGEVNGGVTKYKRNNYGLVADSTENILNIMNYFFQTFPEFGLGGLKEVKIVNVRDGTAGFTPSKVNLDGYNNAGTVVPCQFVAKRNGSFTDSKLKVSVQTTGSGNSQVINALIVSYTGRDGSTLSSNYTWTNEVSFSENLFAFNNSQDYVNLVADNTVVTLNAGSAPYVLVGGADGAALTPADVINQMSAKLSTLKTNAFVLNFDGTLLGTTALLNSFKAFIAKRKKNTMETLVFDTLMRTTDASIDTLDKNTVVTRMNGRNKLSNFVTIGQRFNHLADVRLSTAINAYLHMSVKLTVNPTYQVNPLINFAVPYSNNDPTEDDAYAVTGIGLESYFLYEPDLNQYAVLNAITNYVLREDKLDFPYSKFYSIRNIVYAMNLMDLRKFVGLINFDEGESNIKSYINTQSNQFKSLKLFKKIESSVLQAPDQYGVLFVNLKFYAYGSDDVIVLNYELTQEELRA